MKPLLLGECPSRSRDEFHESPLLGNAGRLCALAQLAPFIARPEGLYIDPLTAPYAALCYYYDVHNVFERFQERWSIPRARDAWFDWLEDHPGPRVIVALGRRAGNVIAAPSTWGEWEIIGPYQVTSIPHPSRRSLAYNYDEFRAVASATLREARVRAGDSLR